MIDNLPQTTKIGCAWARVMPVDYLQGIQNTIPSDFNPRPGTVPTAATVKPAGARQAVSKAKDLDD